ncbi:MAG: response regulator transcription factor [Chloroflexota bacterium]
MNVLAASAEVAIWQGRVADVRAIIDTVSGMAEPAGPPDPSLAWLAALGLRAEADGAATARARRDEPALEMARRRAAAIVAALDHARADPATQAIVSGSSRGQGLASLCAAEARRVERADTPADWAGVAAAWASAGRPFPEAYARFREAESILAARGDRHAAEAALRAADVTARTLGAEPLGEAVRLLARHARIELDPKEDRSLNETVPVAADGASATYGFTERELEVLHLVAGGWSNQQIGDVLFISRKTASVHVSNIMGKLDVRSRVEAAAVAHRLGLGRDAPGPPGST